MLYSTETYRIERTVSTSDMDKFQEAICAFSNDLPNSRKKGYLIIGANDNGRLSGLKVTDALLKKIAAIRSDGNILPLPVMTVESFEYEDGDLLVAEVSPSFVPPVRYRGRTFVRIGPRRDIATEVEERILLERRTSYMATFDAMPCFGATIEDIDTAYIKGEYLLIDAPNSQFKTLINQANGKYKENIREAAQRVLGTTYKLGPYKRENAAAEQDPLKALAEKLEALEIN